MKKLNPIIALIVLTMVFCSCGRHKTEHMPENTEDCKAVIILPEDSAMMQKLEIENIAPEAHRSTLTTSGVVQAIPNNYAQIAAPFAGRITKSFIKLGQRVAVNEPVFEISSPSFYETGRIYYQAKQEMSLAEKNLQRQNDLFANGVGVKKDLEETEVNYEIKKRDYENAVASLKVFNVEAEELVLGQPLVVRSPIQGEVVENAIVLGQYMKEDAEPVVCVAELSKVWIVGHVKEKDIGAIQKTDTTEISLAGMPDQPIAGRIYHISEMLDDETRSVKVFIECNNKNRLIKPGMYVSVKFFNNPENKILIPSTSVFQKEDSSFVFIHTGGNRFTRRTVEIAGTEHDRVIVKSGLTANEQVVIRGGIYLLEANDKI